MTGYRMTPAEQLEDLRSISETVDDFLTRELFKETVYEDDYTINDVLTESYSLILDDVRDMGVTFLISKGDILEDFVSAKGIYYLYKALQPGVLKEHLSKEELLCRVETALQEPDEFTLDNILSFIAEAHPSDYEAQAVLDILPKINGTKRIYKYIQSVCNVVHDEATTIIDPDPIKAKEYIEHSDAVRQAAKRAAIQIYEDPIFIGKIDIVYVHKLLRDYDMDKLSPENLAIYSTVDREDCPEGLHNYKDMMMYKHHCRASHHVEYWVTHPNEPARIEDLLMIAAHFLEPDSTRASFIKELDEQMKVAEQRFDEQQIAMIRKMAMIAAPKE